MTPFKIPEAAYAAVQHLVHLEECEFEAFLNALTQAEPSLEPDEFWRHVALRVPQIDQTVVESILREVFKMNDARTGEEVAEFADQIAEAAVEAKSKDFSFEEDDRKILRDRLIRIFEGRKGLEVTLKASGVIRDHDRVFYYARILTDIRPVFDEGADSVSAAVIVHNLAIHFVENSEHKDFYVALDTSDIQSLRDVLERADKKAACLQRLLKTSGVSYLHEEE